MGKKDQPDRSEFETVHAPLVEYLKWQYKDILFQSDLNGVYLHGKIAKDKARLQMDGGKWLDLFIAAPRIYNGILRYGLFLELKLDIYGGSGYLKKDGTIRLKDKHIQSQYATILKFRQLGYWAAFAGTFEQAKLMVDVYLSGESQ